MDKEFNICVFLTELVNWLCLPANYLIVQYLAENSLTRRRVEKLCEGNQEAIDLLDDAYTIQEYKISVGALEGKLEKSIALRMLETFHNWKQTPAVVVQNNVVTVKHEDIEERIACLPSRN